MFSLKFKTDNAAFGGDKEYETVRILKEISHKIEMGYKEGIVQDINGQTVGSFKLR